MDRTSGSQRWLVLAIGMTGLIAACAFQYGLPYLLPSFLLRGVDLAQAGLLVSAPVFGVLCALVLWGAVTDRLGERWVLAAGLTGAALALTAASRAADSRTVLWVLLFVAGASAACVQVASGRLILGWFPVELRGLAMGLRQTGQPLGVGLAALALPRLGARGLPSALIFLAACCAAAAVLIAVGVRDAQKEPTLTVKAASPYRDSYLGRVHLASTLLVIPQFAVAAFAFEFLLSRGWGSSKAGPLLALAAVGGAGIRLAAGWWSDRAGSRLRPMRWLCLAIGVVLLALAIGMIGSSRVTGFLLIAVVLASVLTVSTNGLAFTAVAERAGRAWAGRALGVQNTAQNLAAAATPPVIGAVISRLGSRDGYPVAFSAIVVLPLLAAMAIPVGAERSSQPQAPADSVQPGSAAVGDS